MKHLIKIGTIPMSELFHRINELEEIEIRMREKVGTIESKNGITYMIEDIYTQEDFRTDSVDVLVRVVLLDNNPFILSEQLKDLLLNIELECKEK